MTITLTHMATTFLFFIFLVYFFQKMQVGDTRVTYRQDHLKSQTIPPDTHTRFLTKKRSSHTLTLFLFFYFILFL